MPPAPRAGSGSETTTTSKGAAGGSPPTGETGGGPAPEKPAPVSSPTPAPGPRTSIDLTLAADRNGMFAAWPALANLADMAGKITVTVRAESAAGLDKHILEHAVLEPLRELGLIGDESGS